MNMLLNRLMNMCTLYMDPWDKIHEENRFLNWYTGFTSLHEEPKYEEGFYRYKIHTSATSGVITSQYFGESYNPSMVDNNLELDRMVDRVKPWIMVNGLAHGL